MLVACLSLGLAERTIKQGYQFEHSQSATYRSRGITKFNGSSLLFGNSSKDLMPHHGTLVTTNRWRWRVTGDTSRWGVWRVAIIFDCVRCFTSALPVGHGIVQL